MSEPSRQPPLRGVPAPNLSPTRRLVIGVGELAVTQDREITLSTYALGSCVGVVAYDPAQRIGGMIHFMLPESRIAPGKAAAQPAMFADTGLPEFFRQLAALNATTAHLNLFLAGGASILGGVDPFRIGERNRSVTLSYIRNGKFHIAASELGGAVNRTLHLDMNSGNLTVKTGAVEIQIALGS